MSAAETIDKPEVHRKSKADVPAAKPAKAAKTTKATRLRHVGSDGPGGKAGELATFLHMSTAEQTEMIREGMEAKIVGRIASELLHMPLQSLLVSLRLPSSTINRKISSGERLSASESDRAARTILIHAQAADVLEDGELAAQWLQRPNAELSGERPIDMLDTQTGFDRVRDILVRLEHGIAV